MRERRWRAFSASVSSIECGNRKEGQGAALAIVYKAKSVCFSVVDRHAFHPWRTLADRRQS